jgi:hypothetical protein
MAGTHGGKRPGAGRKRKVAAPKADSPQTSTGFYADAEAYLVAVVEGREQAEPARIMAAKTLIMYQRQRQRAPIASLAPRQLARTNATAAERDRIEAWERRAREIEAKHRRKTQ